MKELPTQVIDPFFLIFVPEGATRNFEALKRAEEQAEREEMVLLASRDGWHPDVESLGELGGPFLCFSFP